MILVRNVFQVKFGKSKDAVQAWKEMMGLAKRLGLPAKSSRLLTDLVGNFYTVVFEHTFDSIGEMDAGAATVMSSPEWQAAYAKIVAVTESGHREIFNIVHEQ